MKIAIQGIEGSFHHIAVANLFGDAVYELVPCDSFVELIDKTKANKDYLGVMAIENSIAGSLLGNYKLILENDLVIIAEIYLRIRHQLIVLPGVELKDVKEVHSHPMALNQCRKFLGKHKAMKLVEKTDTALSVLNVKNNNLKNTAAIAGRLAAEMNGMEILESNIETDKNNYTRFLVVEKKNERNIKSNYEKMTLSFEVNNNVGALHHVLAYFASLDINLTKIESAPIIGKVWQYMFFVDLMLPSGFDMVAFKDGLGKQVNKIKTLGQYEKGMYYDD